MKSKDFYTSNIFLGLNLLALVLGLLTAVLFRSIAQEFHIYVGLAKNLASITVPFFFSISIVIGIVEIIKSGEIKNVLYQFLKITIYTFAIVLVGGTLLSFITLSIMGDTDNEKISVHMAELTTTFTDETYLGLNSVDNEVDIEKYNGSFSRRQLQKILTSRFSGDIFNAFLHDRYTYLINFVLLLAFVLGYGRHSRIEKITLFFNYSYDLILIIYRFILYTIPVITYFLITHIFSQMSLQVFLVFAHPIVCFLIFTLISGFLAIALLHHVSKKPLLLIMKYYSMGAFLAFGTGTPLTSLPSNLIMFDKLLPKNRAFHRFSLPINFIFAHCTYFLLYCVITLFAFKIFYGKITAGNILLTVLFSGLGSLIFTHDYSGSGSLSFVLQSIAVPVGPMLGIFQSVKIIFTPLLSLLTVNINILLFLCLYIAEETRKKLGKVNFYERNITFRFNLIGIIVALILFSGVLITGISYNFSKQSALHLTENILEEIGDTVIENTTHHMEAPYRVGESLSYLIGHGDIRLSKEKDLYALFEKYLIDNPEIEAIYWALPSGRLIMAKRMTNDSISHRLVFRENDRIIERWYHRDNFFRDIYPDTESPLDKGYDPRKRDWYANTVKTKTPQWSDIYFFYTDSLPGFTRSYPVYSEDSEFLGVLGLDIGMESLSHLLQGQDKKDYGMSLYILNERNHVIATSPGKELLLKQEKTTRQVDNMPELIEVEEFELSVVSESFKTHRNTFTKEPLHSYKDGKIRYFAMIIPFKASSFAWRLGIIVPEEAVMSEINRGNFAMILISFLFIIVAIVVGTQMSDSIYAPLRKISLDMDRASKFVLSDKLQLGTRIKEIHDMNGSFSKMKNAMRSFSYYAPSQVVKKLISRGEIAVLGGERRNLTTLFSDVANFTTISEQLEPEELVRELEKYLSHLCQIIMEKEGTVDKFIGDAIMAFWGAPDVLELHAYRACESALTCQSFLTEFNKNQVRRGKPEFITRIGLNTGETIVGNIGASTRLNYTVMGDPVNLASRLEGLNKYYNTSIIINETTAEAVRNDFEMRAMDLVAVKGKNHSVVIYELIGKKNELDEDFVKGLRYYELSLKNYIHKNLEQAEEYCQKALEYIPQDGPSEYLMARIKDARESNGKNWSKVNHFASK